MRTIKEYIKEGRGGKNPYPYLSKKHSDLYDKVKNSEDKKDKIIKELIEEIGEGSISAHCSCRY